MKQVQRVHRGSTKPFAQLLGSLTGLNEADTRLLIAMGGAYLGKYRCKDPAASVRDGDPISAYWRLPLVMEPVPFDPNWIITEGDGVLLANKPSGLPTQGRRDADYMAFYELLKGHLKGYLGLHHRLDQDTSGLMLYARNKALNKDIARAFQERLIHKEYLAVVSGFWPFPQDEAKITNPIGSQTTPRGRRHMVMKNGKKAETHVRLLAQADELLLVRVKPLTGRTHQIRIHLAKHGMPLWGDTFYGGPEGPTFHLHCAKLAWPQTGMLKEASHEVPPPVSWRETLPEDLTGGLWC